MKKKAILGIVGVAVLILAGFNIALANDSLDVEHEIWVVQSGDTLWDIAKQHRGNTDIRKYVYDIQKLNNMGASIHPGQEILLP